MALILLHAKRVSPGRIQVGIVRIDHLAVVLHPAFRPLAILMASSSVIIQGALLAHPYQKIFQVRQVGPLVAVPGGFALLARVLVVEHAKALPVNVALASQEARTIRHDAARLLRGMRGEEKRGGEEGRR